jgi:tetratricopeptide (TPR) repeat protein
MMVIHCVKNGHRWVARYLFPLTVIALLIGGCSRRTASDYLASGDEAMHNTRLAEAESDYQQAARMAPSDPRPHVALGSLYIFEHKPAQAQAELMKALELSPSNANTQELLARAYTGQSELGLAEAHGRAAVALEPAKAEYRLSLGTTLQSEQKTAAAEAEYRTAVGLEPRNAHAHLALATLLGLEPNRHNEAESEYAHVKALDPNLVPTTISLATLPRPATTPTATTAPTEQQPAIRDINKRFLLTRDTPVYESMSQGTRIVAQVHRRRYVHVTGLGGQWLRIQLRNGTIGFIPATAAE